MIKRMTATLSAMLSVVAFGQTPNQTRATLLSDFPDARIHEMNGRVRAVFGVPMTFGASVASPEEEWLSRYAAVFGCEYAELRRADRTILQSSRAVTTYRQYIGDIPIEEAYVRVVQPSEPGRAIHAVFARVSQSPDPSWGSPSITAGEAIQIASQNPAANGIGAWDEPELAGIYDDLPGRDAKPRLVWKCLGSRESLFDSAYFYVDAIEGRVIRVQSTTIPFADGSVQGNRSPGTKPDTSGTGPPPAGCDNPPVLLNMPFTKIEALDGNGKVLGFTYADTAGDYSLNLPGTVELRASLRGRG